MTRRARTNAFVLLGYTGIAFLYFGFRLLPHPGRAVLGAGRDPQIFIWSFAWWPHAIGNWENPFVTHAIYAPDGINLAWATTVPGLAVPFAPLTILFGPTASYNVAAMLMPALSAFTAFLLCRHLTHRLWPALVGGYLYGFSAYMLGEELGHLHLTSVFCLPLVALVIVQGLQSELGPRAVAVRLGVLLALQLYLSTEVLFTLTFVLALALGLGFCLVPRSRLALRSLVWPIAAGYGIGAILGAPLLYYAATGYIGDSINDPNLYSGDLLNFVVPTHLLAAGGPALYGISQHFPSSQVEQGAYLGIPTLIAVVWFALRERRSPTARFLVVALLATMLATLGSALWIEGHRELSLPWHLLVDLPVFDNVLPVRFAVYGSLAAAVIVALWASKSRRWAAILLPVLAVAALVPGLETPDFRNFPQRLAFFTDGTYKCLPRNENLAIFPYGFWGNSMLWQAESGFWFRMADGYLRPKPPPDNIADPTIRELTYTTANPTMPQIMAFVRDKDVSRILSVEEYVHPDGRQMHRFGELQSSGGMLLAPACGYPALTPHSQLLPPWIYVNGVGVYATKENLAKLKASRKGG
ncbi:MAG TPA: hypothetical protein VG652_03740 [Gaiellaceae bacterium]|nr:hypothetical protein [Gaiellaceae bacterium]